MIKVKLHLFFFFLNLRNDKKKKRKKQRKEKLSQMIWHQLFEPDFDPFELREPIWEK